MKNSINVKIYGADYKIVSEDSSEHVLAVAQKVDAKMRELAEKGIIGYSQLAILTAVNIVDEQMKSGDNADQLRGQLLDYAASASAAQKIIDDLKRDNARLRDELEKSKLRQNPRVS